MDKILIKIKDDFSFTPGPRYIDEGNFSGEDFRIKILFPKMEKAIKENKTLVVDLDGTAGYGTSFLEESFGGLIRVNKLQFQDIIKYLEIVSEEEKYLEDDIFQYLEDANKTD